MSGSGDRQLAGLLSALSEAPDSAAASSFLLAELAEFSRAPRICMLRIDPSQEALVPTACHGMEINSLSATTDLGNVSSPLVVSALGLVPLVGACPLEIEGMDDMDRWTVLPMPQPDFTDAISRIAPGRAAELAASIGTRIVPTGERRLGSAPAGVVVVDGELRNIELEWAVDLVSLAGPVLSRLISLEETWELNERLAQQKDRLTVMVDSLPDPVVITDPSNDIIAQNSRAERLLHTREDDSPGRRRAIELNNLLFTSFLSHAVMTGSSQPEGAQRELNLVDPDEGHDLLFEVLNHPLSASIGPAGAVLSVLRDVTDLRRASNELERQVQLVRQAEVKATGERDRLNLILENVADPILVTDERSNIILMNDQAEQLFQVPAGGERTRRELQVIRGNDTKVTSFISEFALMDAVARRERLTLVLPGTGQDLPVEVVSGKIRNTRGEPIAIVSVLHDLTRQVENEALNEALTRLNGELEGRIRAAIADLADQNARLQWQAQEVERANRLKSEFLASMSHELRTPINALIGYSALLLDGVLGEVTPKQEDALQRGRTAAEHLLALINDILDLAKIEAGKMPLHVEPVELREVVAEVALQMEPMVRKKALDFTIDVAEDCPVLVTDRTKIRQVLLNLLSNAVKFTTKGYVEVTAQCAPGGIRMDVSDTGIGIREQDLHAIWDDFRQVDQSRTREYGGTGLGLSITRKLLLRLGGSVDVESVYGEGSKFSVFLPLHAPLPEDHHTPISGSTVA